MGGNRDGGREKNHHGRGAKVRKRTIIAKEGR